jgi:hypothetical protein
MRYGIKQIYKGIQNPELILRDLVRRKGDIMNYSIGGNLGENIIEKDWDNLIILDACRYDIFEETNTLDGELSSFHSLGSHTGEFIEQNFSRDSYYDVVYVSANPSPAKEAGAEFAAVDEVWRSGWDETLSTVPPEIMMDRTLEAEREFPNKRIITHFLQPHYPWIGPEGQKFMSEYGYQPQTRDGHIWMQLKSGEVSFERLWKVYRENLQVVLPYVEKLHSELSGKTVITSDHGNAFGEWGVYGHPPRTYISSLTKVPWLELPYERRKSIISVREGENFEEDIPEDRLRDLGYIK